MSLSYIKQITGFIRRKKAAPGETKGSLSIHIKGTCPAIITRDEIEIYAAFKVEERNQSIFGA